MCYGKWGEGDYLKGRPKKGYTCRSKQHVKRRSAVGHTATKPYGREASRSAGHTAAARNAIGEGCESSREIL